MIERVKTRAREVLAKNDDPHGYTHSEAVDNLSRVISESEGGDRLILVACSYFHDMSSHKGREYHVSEPALLEIRGELSYISFPPDKIKPVIEVIKHHEDYGKNRGKLNLETRVFQDADRLDAMGARGIARNFYFNGFNKLPFGTLADMHALDEPYHVGQLTSAIQHFYTKMLRLEDEMNTETGKRIAHGRQESMWEFLKRLELEWQGKI